MGRDAIRTALLLSLGFESVPGRGELMHSLEHLLLLEIRVRTEHDHVSEPCKRLAQQT